MNSNEVICFLEAAQQLSFTRASENLFLTRQAVSRQIIHLESELHTKLFIRYSQTLALTDTGAAYFDFFSSIRHQWDAFQATLQSPAENHTITVGYLEGLDLTQTLLERVFSIGQRDTQIDLKTYDMHNLSKVVQDGQTDFILTYLGPRLDMFTQCSYVPVETIPMVLVVARTIAASGNTPDDFSSFPVVTWLRSGQSHEEAIQKCIQHCMDFGFSCHKVRVSPNRDTARFEIESGRCVGICTAIDRMASSPSVVTFPLQGTSTIACMWRTHDRSPVVRRIVAGLTAAGVKSE